MGCIWIRSFLCFCSRHLGLTITWDVFELGHHNLGRILGSGLTITWDVFEYGLLPLNHGAIRFNYNMGCIWMMMRSGFKHCAALFNYNMGCIWIYLTEQSAAPAAAFNYNMGCIWINQADGIFFGSSCLTITWDVFELVLENGTLKTLVRLTITWDVFEYATNKAVNLLNQFNYNMGCIWIPGGKGMAGAGQSLTITWDVFECVLLAHSVIISRV